MDRTLFDIETDWREYSRLLEKLADAILLVDEEGNIVYHSDNLTDHLGYREEELINNKIYSLDTELTKITYPSLWRRLCSLGRIDRESEFLHSDGTARSVHMAIHHGAGRRMPSCWLIRFTKVTERQYRLLDYWAAHFGSAAWEWHLINGTFIVTDQFYELFELPERKQPARRDNIINLLKDRLTSQQIVQLTQAIRRIRETKEPFEKILTIKWGTIENKVTFISEPILEDNRVIGLRGIIQDFTTHKENSRQNELAKLTLDKSTSLVFWLAPDCSFAYVNQSACTVLGYSRKELVSGNMLITDIDVDTTEEQWEEYWSQLKEEEVMSLESFMQRKDGTVFPVSLYLSYLEDGDYTYLGITARDITVSRRKEARLKAALLEINSMSQQLEAENIYLQEEVSSGYEFENIITSSNNYKKVLQQIQQVAPMDTTVLILGETGTGKELLARAVHSLSRRKKRPLLKVDCASLPPTLIESELFGHVKGAFTGANKDKPGRFEVADGGTIFLDEVGELPLELQAKLLRVLQEGVFERLGSHVSITVDVRIITATNRNLETMVEKGTFRRDLFYRLNVFPIINIPLRERKEDILPLVKHFIKRYSEKVGKEIKGVTKSALEKLKNYDFPGNIRELENIIERAVILSSGNMITLDQWNSHSSQEEKGATAAPPEEEFMSFEKMQRRYILRVLEKTNWKVSGVGGAAELLELNAQTLYSKMRRLGIKRNPDSY